MDAYSKRKRDCFSTNFYIEDIQLNRLSFVDNMILFQLSKVCLIKLWIVKCLKRQVD